MERRKDSVAVLLGVCCLVSGIVNILHAHRSPSSTVVQEHLKDFREPPTKKNAKKVVLAEDQADQSPEQDNGSSLQHLSCQAYGGPPDEFAQEMVYWKDIPSDEHFVSPFHARQGKRYMTFERT